MELSDHVVVVTGAARGGAADTGYLSTRLRDDGKRPVS